MREPTIGGVIVTVSLLGMLAAAPLLGDYTVFVLALVVIHVIAVLSLNLLMGYAGQVSLGQAALVGIGAYGAAQLAAWGVPFPLPLLGAVVVTAAAATIVGLPSLRIKGLQVAATTLAIGLVAENLIFPRPWDPASGTGVLIARPAFLADGRAFLALVAGALIGVFALDRAIRRSGVGRALFAVRDRDDTAAARGVAVGPTKLLAYALSGVYAGIAGGLYAYLLEVVTPDGFTVFVSLGYVAAVIVGGAGSGTGVAIAAATFAALPELLRPARTYAPLAGAALLAAVPLLRPDGLAWLVDRAVPRRTPRHRPEDEQRTAPVMSAVVEAHRELGPPRRPLSLTAPVHVVLRARDVAVAFGGVRALTGVDFEVRRGEIVGLIGSNGAGKSTLFNVLSGFIRPDTGRIEYRGRDLRALPADARPGLGIARTFQQVGLSPKMSVHENVLAAQHSAVTYGTLAALVRAPSVRRVERELALRADAALSAVGVAGLADEPLGRLPHGQQRLAEVAGALAIGPDLLLLDEPFAGLGPEESDVFAHRLLDLQARHGFAIVLIEHDVPLIAQVCDYIYALDQGAVIAEGTAEQIQRDPLVASVYLGEPAARAPEKVTVHA